MPKHYRHSRQHNTNGPLMRKMAQQLKLVLNRRREDWKYSLIDDSELNSQIQIELEEQGFVTQQDRDDECTYILTLGQSLQLSCDTFCLAFSLLDRTIGALKIRKRLIRLLAITCLKIAIKFTEDDKRENLNRQLCEACGYQFSKRDVNRMEFFVLEKLEWNTFDSSPCDILYCIIDILSNGKDFLSNHQKKSIASFLSCQLVSWDLAKIPNMEIALGCITTIFGSRAAQRIAILMNLYGLKLNQDKVLQASIFLKPKARMISLRYVSKYHKFCIEDSTEGELFFDVKKLMTRGDLTPILFGSKSWAEVVRCWPIKSVRHTQTSQSEPTLRGLFRSEYPTPFSTPPSLHNSCFPIQFTLTSIFSNERPLVDLNFFRKRNEPKTSYRFQLLKFNILWAYFARLYVSVPFLVANLVELTCTCHIHDDVIMCDSYVMSIKRCSAESPSCYSHFWNCQIAQFRVFVITISLCDYYGEFIVGTQFWLFSKLSTFGSKYPENG